MHRRAVIHTALRYAKYFSGDAESRTRVQTKHEEAFYMFIFQLDFRVIDRIGNPPVQ